MNIVPSIELIPAKYGVGTLLTQVPMDVSGDFSVTRATAVATRYNSAGLIETIPSGIPRLDYYTSSGTPGCPALLVEPSGTNLALQSEAFNTTWSPVQLLAFNSGSVINTTGTLDPYGTNVADFIVPNTTLNQHRADQTTVSAAGSYTFSVFLKSGGYDFARLRIGLAGANFNLANGTITATDTGIISAIQSYGNGWYRCIVSKAVSAANEIIRINVADSASAPDFQGNGTSGLYFFGAQYETGSVATSYIPTTTGSVTRDADVINKTGVSGLIGQTEGTIYAEVDIVNFANDGRIVAISDGTLDNRFGLITKSGNIIRAEVIAAGSGQVLINTAALTSGVYKIALAYKQDDFAFYVNGAQIGTDTSGTVPACSQIFLGKRETTTLADFLNNRIRAAAIYKTRLPNYLLESATSQIQSYSALASSLSYTVV
jgi:hypothetical protein